MNARRARNIEDAIDRIASLTFAAAVAFAAFVWVGDGHEQLRIVAGALVGSAAYLLCGQVLGALARRQPSFTISMFEIADGKPLEELLLTDADRVSSGELILTEADRLVDELVLTDSDRLGHSDEEPLILDDILEAMGPDSRVVRMFDRRAMPTPGDLKSRIDSHFEAESATRQIPDASQELSSALADLRNALR